MVPVLLALAAAVAAAGGAGVVAWMVREAVGARHPYEARVGRWLPWVAALVFVVWAGLTVWVR
jgi:hypothetical protein